MKTTIKVPIKTWVVFTGEVMRIEGPRKINIVINQMIEDYIKEAKKIGSFAAD